MMEDKPVSERPYLLSVSLFVLSIIALVFMGLLIYTGLYYVETQRGLAIYLSETFKDYPFGLIYILLLVSCSVLLVAVFFMWRRRKLGLFLYVFWSIVHIVMLLFVRPIDWFNIAMLFFLAIVLLRSSSYFNIKFKKPSSGDSLP